MIQVALYEPEIPGNAGNIARVCAATGSPLHLVGRLGFSFRHPAAQRAAMRYWEQIELHHHAAYGDFREHVRGQRVWKLSTRGSRPLWSVDFAAGDVLLFGPESRGLPDEVLDEEADRVVHIPILPTTRSLNLSNAVAISLYEALRQLGWSPPPPAERRSGGAADAPPPAS